MKIIAGLIAVLVLSGCESRYNPSNWSFGGGGSPTLAPKKGYEEDADPRPLVEQVVSVSVENVPGGAIITAVGLPPTIGYWKVDLVPTYETATGKPTSQNGIMWLEFKAVFPLEPKPSVSQAAREVTAGIYLSDQALRNAQQIVVVGEANERAARR